MGGDQRLTSGAASFREQERPIILGDAPHSHLSQITPAAIAAETRRLFGINRGKRSLLLGLRPGTLAAVACHVSHLGLKFHDVSASIVDEHLLLSGTVKKGPFPLLRHGRLVIANSDNGLRIVDGSLGSLTGLVGGDINRIITEPMSESLGSEFSVDQVRIATPQTAPGLTESVLTARVTRRVS